MRHCFYYSVPCTQLMLRYLKLYHVLPGYSMNILFRFLLKSKETDKSEHALKILKNIFNNMYLKVIN